MYGESTPTGMHAQHLWKKEGRRDDDASCSWNWKAPVYTLPSIWCIKNLSFVERETETERETPPKEGRQAGRKAGQTPELNAPHEGHSFVLLCFFLIGLLPNFGRLPPQSLVSIFFFFLRLSLLQEDSPSTIIKYNSLVPLSIIAWVEQWMFSILNGILSLWNERTTSLVQHLYLLPSPLSSTHMDKP